MLVCSVRLCRYIGTSRCVCKLLFFGIVPPSKAKPCNSPTKSGNVPAHRGWSRTRHFQPPSTARAVRGHRTQSLARSPLASRPLLRPRNLARCASRRNRAHPSLARALPRRRSGLARLRAPMCLRALPAGLIASLARHYPPSR